MRDLQIVGRVQPAAPGSRAGATRRSGGLHPVYGLLATVAACLLWSGCQGPQQPVTRPTRHSVRADYLLVLSDFKLSKEHPLIQDLIQLRRQVAETLQLPEQRREVVVYLFSSEGQYRRYLQAAYPGLPHRRAYFVGTPKELAVFTFWGDRIQEDLRHEYTHGVLHASLKSVPLWIDEGLAEYFEVAGPRPGTVNVDYAHRLAASLANGWRPDMQRLERLEEFSQMQRIDYQEAWAWVHYMLHGAPESRQVLLDYLHDLKTDPAPRPLSERLAQSHPQLDARFTAYLASLNTVPLWNAAAQASGRHKPAGTNPEADASGSPGVRPQSAEGPPHSVTENR